MTPAESLSLSGPRKRKKRSPPPAAGRVPAWPRCRLLKRRESLNLSLRTIAGAAGLSVSAYWKIEQGGDLRLTTARRIATLFGCRVETLWPGE